MIRIGILGAAGYTGGELIRLLVNHPQAEIVFAHSESNGGRPVSDVHTDLVGDTDMRFSTDMPFDDADFVFLCFGHGKSEAFLKEHAIPPRVKIIDLAQDFRIRRDGNPFVYGLPEIHRTAIAGARCVANPGCFATCLQLGLLPLAKAGLIDSDVVVNAVTGSTGAGQKPQPTTHFSWRTDNMSVYKPFRHQHLAEICQSLNELGANISSFDGDSSRPTIDFIPWRGDFARGIFATMVTRCTATAEDIVDIYKSFYADEPFTHYVDGDISLKQVVNTNKCLIHCEKDAGRLLITAAIDNLLKGAVGQAVQNMNIMAGIDEITGLRLKASAF
ncbi:MAG: N-acetyl-gamma-glutamyl-phosphate reductase [Prevotella sp.]|nr:N-acetyl-gamma-glutamyl-phosphate reductase [Prevotella sp.]